MFDLPIYSVVAKKDNKWFIGSFNKEDKFVKKREVKKLKDVKEVSSYTSLKIYLKKNKYDKLLEKKIMEKTGLKSIYVLNKPVDPDEEEWNKYWWKEHNNVCKKCTHNCKQSYKTIIYKCNKFEEK